MVKLPVNTTAVVISPSHNTILEIAFTVGVGLIVNVNCCAALVQVFEAAVTEIVASTGTFARLVAVKAAILPVEPALKPIPGSVFVQV